MSNEKLSTGCALSTASLKKREGKKKPSPLNPYKEKGKGKEHRRGSLQNRLSRACLRARLREALDRDLDIAVRAFRGTKSDRSLWASIAWRVGVEEFHYALRDKLSENRADKTILLTPPAAFQAFLNERFPKPKAKGGAGSGTASREFSEFINSESAAGAKDVSAVVGEAAKAGGVR